MEIKCKKQTKWDCRFTGEYALSSPLEITAQITLSALTPTIAAAMTGGSEGYLGPGSVAINCGGVTQGSGGLAQFGYRVPHHLLPSADLPSRTHSASSQSVCVCVCVCVSVRVCNCVCV
jgi:hypothetical protein